MNIDILGGGLVPTGTIISYMGNNAPYGYLKCDGTIYNILDYPDLAEHFETEFGTKNNFGGDGETTFAVPNLQGEFLRCTGTNPNQYSGNGANVGEHQTGTFIPFVWSGSHIAILPNNSPGNWDYLYSVTKAKYIGGNNTGADTTASKSYIPRPTNTSVWYCIKY